MSNLFNSARLLVLCLGLSSCVTESSTGEDRSEIGDGDDVVCIEIAPDCADGEVPGDTDGDGCLLECVPAPVACIELAVECPAGETPGDTDGDGCALECVPGPVPCPAVWPECPAGEVPGDSNGDGCAIECVPDPDAP